MMIIHEYLKKNTTCRKKTTRYAGIPAEQSEIPVSRASLFFIWQFEDFYEELAIAPRSRQTETVS